MVKLTKKQKQEINFLIKYFSKQKPSEQEIEEYINCTVKGIHDKEGKLNNNKLFQAKRKLDINIKMWKEDLRDGMLSVNELLEDFNHIYFKKIIKTIMKGIVDKKEFKGDKFTVGVSFINRAIVYEN